MSAAYRDESSKVVYEEDAYEALQGLRNGLFRAVIDEIGRIAGARQADGQGTVRVTMADVSEAFKAVASRYIEQQDKERKIPT
jgi:hypothetical protein